MLHEWPPSYLWLEGSKVYHWCGDTIEPWYDIHDYTVRGWLGRAQCELKRNWDGWSAKRPKGKHLCRKCRAVSPRRLY